MLTNTSNNNFLAEENPPITTEAASVECSEPHLEYSKKALELKSDSVVAQVNSTIALSEGMEKLKGDEEQRAKFLMALCNAKLLTKEEATSADQSASVQSKWRKMKRYADIVLHERVLPFLSPGYKVMYDFSLLIKDLEEEDNKNIIDKVSARLSTLDGPMTREWIKKERDALKPPKPPKKVKPPKDLVEMKSPSIFGGDEPPAPTVASDEPAASTAKPVGGEIAEEAEQLAHNAALSLRKAKQSDVVVADAGEPITAALLIVNNYDEGALLLAAEGDRWQRMADQMAEDSAIFVFARLDVLLNISWIVKTFGPCGCANLYLLSEPDKLEATKCNVLAIFERGDGVFVEGVPNWKASDSPFVIAEQFLLGVSGRRLQFFAEVPVPGWEALTVDWH